MIGNYISKMTVIVRRDQRVNPGLSSLEDDFRSKWNVTDDIHHDDVIKWKHFPHYWPLVWGIHLSPGEFPSQRPETQSFVVFFDLRFE